MSNYLLLTKVFFLAGFSTNKKKNSQKPVFKNLGFLALMFLGISTFYNLIQFLTFSARGEDYREILVFFLSISAVLIITITFNQMQNTIFGSKDYEMVSSLPVSNMTVVAARITAILLICICEDLLIFLPTVVIYFIATGDVFVTLVSFVCVFFVSLMPLLLSTILGTLVAVITKKIKKKNVFQIFVYFLYFILIFILSFSMNNTSVISNGISKMAPQLKLYVNAIYNYDIVPFLLFIALNIVSFVLVVLIISLLYRPINRMKSNDGGEGKVKLDTNLSDIKKILFKKETKMFTGNPNYLVNSMFGTLMFPLLSIMFVLVNFAPNAPAEAQQEVQMIFVGMAPFMGLIMNSVANSASAAFSLEGKQFELLLNYPIDPKEIIKAKMKVGFIYPSVADLVGSTVVTLVYYFGKFLPENNGWAFIVLIYIAPQLALLFTTIVSTLCNLRWPKIDFENEMQAIKNSKSGLYAMLFISLPSMVVVLLLFFLTFISYIASLIGVVVLYGIAITVVYLILKKHGENLFKKIITR